MNNSSNGNNMFMAKSTFVYKKKAKDNVEVDKKKVVCFRNSNKFDVGKKIQSSTVYEENGFPSLSSFANKQQVWEGKSFAEVLKTENKPDDEKNVEKIKEDDFEKMSIL